MKKYAEYEEYKINIDETMFNDAYLPYIDKVYRYEVYWGGAGSGKSFYIAQKLAIQMTMMNGRNLVVLRKQAVDCRDSAYPDIYNAMVEFNLLQFWHVVEHPLVRMTCLLNGNTILFNGVDDIENIKSIKFKGQKSIDGEPVGNLTDVWYEEASEEPSEDAIEELNRRMRDRRMQCRIILSFNPIFMEHWLKGWMEKKEKEAKNNYMFLRTTYKDNRFLPKDYIQMLEDYRMTNPYAYQVYALGNWGTMGQSVFDVNKIADRLTVLYAEEGRYVRSVDFMYETDIANKPKVESMKPFDLEDGDTTIYEEPDPDAPYVLAFDSAGEGADYAAAQVINNATLNQAAVFHSLKNPVECVHQVICLAYYYNTALIVPELNFGRYELEKMLEYGYPNIYQRNKPSDTMGSDYEAKYGFITTVGNRSGILAHLVEYVAQNVKTFNDVTTLNEMTTFTRQFKKGGAKGWWGAAPGAHDDLVMAMAIAVECKDQQTTEKVKRIKEVKGFWYPVELSRAVKAGKMEEEEARAYMKSRKDLMTALIGDVETYDFYA